MNNNAPPHRFNRFEIKYLLPETAVDSLKEDISTHLHIDPLSPPGGYRVESLYYDTAGLKFYWEKIEGLKFRRKVRIRHYGSTPVTDTTPVQVEIKQRVNKVTQKRRITAEWEAATALCTGTVSEDTPDPVSEEIAAMAKNWKLQPTAVTTYLREAYSGSDLETGLRITFDHQVSGRMNDFILGHPDSAHNIPIVAPGICVVELKADERVPLWMTDLAARHHMSVIRMSKYCSTIDAFNKGK